MKMILSECLIDKAGFSVNCKTLKAWKSSFISVNGMMQYILLLASSHRSLYSAIHMDGKWSNYTGWYGAYSQPQISEIIQNRVTEWDYKTIYDGMKADASSTQDSYDEILLIDWWSRWNSPTWMYYEFNCSHGMHPETPPSWSIIKFPNSWCCWDAAIR